MCILKNSKDLLEYIQSRSFPFDFSTPYTTIPHSKLKDRLREFHLCNLGIQSSDGRSSSSSLVEIPKEHKTDL
jgi:hypothetical protein